MHGFGAKGSQGDAAFSLPTIWALGALALATLFVRPWAHGIPSGRIVAFWAFVGLAVAVPGVALCWAGGLYRRDRALLVGQGLTLGLAVHGLGSLAGRALGLHPFADALLLPCVAAAALAVRRTQAEGGKSRVPVRPLGLLAVVLLALLMQPLAALRDLGQPVPVDLLFHAGNAAEVLHRWPLQDPRSSGLPLNYPVLAYALPAAASRVTGLPVSDSLNGLSPLLWIALLALQTHNLGRALLGDTWAASLGTVVVLLHADPGGLLGLGRGAFLSHFATALYGSPTTVCGLVLFAGLALVLEEVFCLPARIKALSPLLVVFALAASLTKATVVPPAAAACGLVALGALRRRTSELARAATWSGLLLVAAAAPSTVGLGTGETSYRGILRWDPAAVVRQSPLATWALQALALPAPHPEAPSPPAWLAIVLSPVWLAGYLGLAGIGAAAFARHGRGALTGGHVWALGVAASGALPALLLDAHGLSQLFFLYDGQLLLGLLAGGGLVATLRSRPKRAAISVALGLAALPALDTAFRVLPGQARRDYESSGRDPDDLTEHYASGLAWLRANAARGGVVFADNPSLLLSALGECRMFYETGLFTPKGWQERWAGRTEPFPDRAAFQAALLRRPDAALSNVARRLFPPPADRLVVADNVQSRVDSGFTHVAIGPVPARRLFPLPWFELLYANPALHVYSLVDSPANRSPGVAPH